MATPTSGFAFADVAYVAYVGRLAGASGPFDRLRGIAVLQLTPVQLVVGRDSAHPRGRPICAAGASASGRPAAARR